MNTVVRNSLAALAGAAVGSLVNMGLVNIGPLVVPLPDGADVSTMEGRRASMTLKQTDLHAHALAARSSPTTGDVDLRSANWRQ